MSIEQYDARAGGGIMHSEIKSKAIDLLNNPARTFGRAIYQSLSDVIGAAIVQASKPAKLGSEDFERLRQDILRTMRTPR
jgi:hypothetical protein